MVGEALAGLVNVTHKGAFVAPVIGEPSQATLHGAKERLHLGFGQSPPPHVVQQTDPQRGRINSAVIDGRKREDGFAVGTAGEGFVLSGLAVARAESRLVLRR